MHVVMSESMPVSKLSSLDLSGSNFKVIPFAIEVPESPELKCIVGTVTMMNMKAAMIWLGWGSTITLNEDSESNQMVGCGLPRMGPLVVGMPRTKYQGFGGDEAACSQLISGVDEEEMMLGWRMAARLSKKLGMAIYCACALSGGVGLSGIMDPDTVSDDMETIRACALVEKEIERIIASLRKSLPAVIDMR